MVRVSFLAGPCMALVASLGCVPLEVSREPAVAEPPGATRHPPEPEVERPSPEEPLTIKKAVDIAMNNYPAILAARARVDAAKAGVALANTAYLPRLDLLWQELRSTRNNISGVLFPQPVVPAISGPVSDTTSWDSAWGSAAGALLSYEPFDFGLRGATVDAARASTRQASAEVEATRLEVATTAAETFLTMLAAQETVRAAQANVDRRKVFAQSVHALVDQQLRPGVDASRSDAQLAQAQIQFIQAQQTTAVAQAALIEALGLPQGPLTIDSGPLLDLPIEDQVPPFDFTDHPFTLSRLEAIEAVRAREKALESAFLPRVLLQAGLYGRGSGFDFAGRTLNEDDGLLPDRGNWAVGISFVFSPSDYFPVKARRAAEEGNEREERARLDQLLQGLKAQDARVRAALEAALRVVEQTPIQRKAAQDAHTQATTRYQTGLGTVTEVAETQQLLAQSEIDDAIARVAVWRALVAAARLQGDIAPLLNVMARTPRR
jgi:outer membrane protein